MAILRELRYFPEFVKISHSVFALPFALGSLLIAKRGTPSIHLLALVVAAVFCARFTAMAFNRIVDAKYDALNPRTSARHIPAGKISVATAWGIVVVGIFLFIGISFAINTMAFRLSPIALVIVLSYSFMKRFTRFSHFVLGAALSLAPLGAWVAIQGNLSNTIPWLISLAVVCWVAGFDMIYALQDADFDRKQGLHSMVVALGEKRTLTLVPVLHLMMVICLIAMGIKADLGILYYGGLAFVVGSLVWEQWLVLHLDDSNLQKAFFQANAIASFGFLGGVILAILFK